MIEWLKSFPKQDCIPAPPLFIEEVDAKRTEEFIDLVIEWLPIQWLIKRRACGWKTPSRLRRIELSLELALAR